MYLAQEGLAGRKVTEGSSSIPPLHLLVWGAGGKAGREGAACSFQEQSGVTGVSVAPQGNFRDEPQLSQLLDLVPRTA